MRLTPDEIAAITAAARDAFGGSTVVRLREPFADILNGGVPEPSSPSPLRGSAALPLSRWERGKARSAEG